MGRPKKDVNIEKKLIQVERVQGQHISRGVLTNEEREKLLNYEEVEIDSSLLGEVTGIRPVKPVEKIEEFSEEEGE